jgi:hypothetical protein
MCEQGRSGQFINLTHYFCDYNRFLRLNRARMLLSIRTHDLRFTAVAASELAAAIATPVSEEKCMASETP